jgi:hypothetical protein
VVGAAGIAQRTRRGSANPARPTTAATPMDDIATKLAAPTSNARREAVIGPPSDP